MEFNPFSYEIQDDPYPSYRRLRDEAPCYHNTSMDFYALSRFEDCWNSLLDWQTFSSSHGPSMELLRGGDDFSLIGIDPPRHTQLRNLISRGFTPRRIEALEPRIRELVRSYLEPLVDGATCEIQSLLGARLPMAIICELVGIPEHMNEQICVWSNLSLHREPGQSEPPPEAAEADESLRAYLRGLLRDRKGGEGDDVLSVLVAAESDEAGERVRLTDDDIVAFLNLLAAAGNETTTKLIGNAIVLLALYPDQRAALCTDPARIPQAIEEILRYESPSQNTGRVTLRDVDLHGTRIPSGSRVMILTGAACRDEREYPDPDRFDIARQPGRALYFGHGHHVCIGKSLARLEARIVLEELLARFPLYEVDPDSLERTHQSHVRGYSKISLRL
jgi:cytochrome P450